MGLVAAGHRDRQRVDFDGVRRARGAATMEHPPRLLASPGQLVAGRYRGSRIPRRPGTAGGPLLIAAGRPRRLRPTALVSASGTLQSSSGSAAEVSIDAVGNLRPGAPGLTLVVALLLGPALDLVIEKQWSSGSSDCYQWVANAARPVRNEP